MDWNSLKRMSETRAVPGREDAMRELVRAQMQPLVDEIQTDVMGNVIGIRRGAAAGKVMVAAHMDEIGFYVRHVDDKGFLRLQPVGGFDPRQLFAQRVVVTPRHGDLLRGVLCYSTKPTHMLTPEEAKAPAKIESFFVDLGLPADDVKERVAVGDMVTIDRECIECGDTLVGKCLDDRVGIFVMLETLRKLSACEHTIYAVATVQEEVGLRGASVSSFALEPDVSIALDTTLACDHPGPSEMDVITRLGEGVAIKILDSSLICHPKLVEHFRRLAEAHEIPHQMEILPRGGTDAGAMQRSGGGSVSMTLSIPSRYVHTANEMVHKRDVEAAVDLLCHYLEDCHNGDYAYA